MTRKVRLPVFQPFPGVLRTDGKVRSAFVDVAGGGVFAFDPRDLDDPDTIEELVAARVGLALQEGDPLLTEEQPKLLRSLAKSVTVMLKGTTNLRALETAPDRVEYFSAGPLDELGRDDVRRKLRAEGWEGPVTFREFSATRCHLRAEDDAPVIEAHRYAINQEMNPCWGASLGLDERGDVRPCLWSARVAGNVSTESPDTIKARLAEYWNLTKDSIEVCSDCERRYVCSDCRVLAEERGGALTSKTANCDYDPREE
jgi:radical SAM protein with 4Fe4S-binding SPASM domain